MGQKTGSVQSAGGNRQPSSWCVAVHWNFNCTLWWIRAPPDLGDTAQNGGVKIPRATFVANADGHVFKDDKTTFVAQRFALDATFAHCPITAFARETVHMDALLYLN